tara:strand:+ start:14813 stop:15394 length:582 start_codon:yes stop_codon:yes gene_type:complete
MIIRIQNILQESKNTIDKLLKSEQTTKNLQEVVEIVFNTLSTGKKLLLCGNGGSAADAQHIAAEFTGRFFKDRNALFAEALHVNSSYMTAVANDYGFEKVYSRLLEAKGIKDDVLIAISTSGNSPNIVNAVQKAKEIGMITISFTGQNDSKIKDLSQICLQSPSKNTPRIQEIHILFGHIICQLVEEKIFPNV